MRFHLERHHHATNAQVLSGQKERMDPSEYTILDITQAETVSAQFLLVENLVTAQGSAEISSTGDLGNKFVVVAELLNKADGVQNSEGMEVAHEHVVLSHDAAEKTCQVKNP